MSNQKKTGVDSMDRKNKGLTSLYVCDFPSHVEKKELQEIFAQFEGFEEVRVARDRNRQKIAFVDYRGDQQAHVAMTATRSYRFPGSSSGITVRFSDNSKNAPPGFGNSLQSSSSFSNEKSNRRSEKDRQRYSSSRDPHRERDSDRNRSEQYQAQQLANLPPLPPFQSGQQNAPATGYSYQGLAPSASAGSTSLAAQLTSSANFDPSQATTANALSSLQQATAGYQSNSQLAASSLNNPSLNASFFGAGTTSQKLSSQSLSDVAASTMVNMQAHHSSATAQQQNNAHSQFLLSGAAGSSHQSTNNAGHHLFKPYQSGSTGQSAQQNNQESLLTSQMTNALHQQTHSDQTSQVNTGQNNVLNSLLSDLQSVTKQLKTDQQTSGTTSTQQQSSQQQQPSTSQFLNYMPPPTAPVQAKWPPAVASTPTAPSQASTGLLALPSPHGQQQQVLPSPQQQHQSQPGSASNLGLQQAPSSFNQLNQGTAAGLPQQTAVTFLQNLCQLLRQQKAPGDMSSVGGAKFAMSDSGIFPIPANATSTVYVEGLPADATEREVAHIFRPFQGYRTLRLIPREKRQGERTLLCFADFENPLQSTIVVNTLQGYRFDREDTHGLYFSYATAIDKSGREQAQNAATSSNKFQSSGAGGKQQTQLSSGLQLSHHHMKEQGRSMQPAHQYDLQAQQQQQQQHMQQQVQLNASNLGIGVQPQTQSAAAGIQHFAQLSQVQHQLHALSQHHQSQMPFVGQQLKPASQL